MFVMGRAAVGKPLSMCHGAWANLGLELSRLMRAIGDDGDGGRDRDTMTTTRAGAETRLVFLMATTLRRRGRCLRKFADVDDGGVEHHG